MDEMRLPIPWWAEFYEVSQLWRIRKRSNKKVMKPTVNERWYLRVGLVYPWVKQFKRRVNRLVALTRIPNPLGLTEVNHLDGNKFNNMVSNLEWVTHAENLRHAREELNIQAPMIWRFWSQHPKSKPIIQLTLDNQPLRTRECVAQAAGHLNCAYQSLCAAANHKIRKSNWFKREWATPTP